MGEVVALENQYRPAKPVFFDRRELRHLMNVYSRRVSAGDWRDYAIDFQRGQAVFSIFRHTSEAPLYRVAKTGRKGRSAAEYSVSEGPRLLKRGPSISEVLSVIERRLELVT